MVATPLHGLGRVPVVAPNGSILLYVYSDVTRTYDYKLFGSESDEPAWTLSLPHGGYGRPAILDGQLAFGATDFTGLAVMNIENGSHIRTIELGRRIRSSPAVTAGAVVIGAGDTLVVAGPDGILQRRDCEGHVFFGEPAVLEDRFLALSVHRDPVTGVTGTYVSAFGADDLTPVWSTRIGPDFIVSSDTSRLCVTGQSCVVTSPSGEVMRLKVESGAVEWVAALRSGLTGDTATIWRSAPAVSEKLGIVAVGSLEGELWTLEYLNGEVRSHCQLDAFGIWSPPTIDADKRRIYAHDGPWLSETDLDGRPLTRTPVGFNAYTECVLEDDRVILCGGDPPDYGFLFVASRSEAAEADGSSEVAFGERSDQVTITVNVVPDVERVTLDLSHFGGSEAARCHRRAPKVFTWAGPIDLSRRNSSTVVVGRAYSRSRSSPVVVPVDQGASAPPPATSARTLEDSQLPTGQETRTESGPETVRALAAALGRGISLDDAEDARVDMLERGVHPHHIWRGGSARIFMASRLPLPEKDPESGPPSVEIVLDQWEDSEPDATNRA